MQIMARKKLPVSYALDPKLVARMKAWIDKQDLPPSQTIVIETAIKEFLDKRERTK